MNLYLLVVDPQNGAYQLGYAMGMMMGIIMLFSIPLLLVLSIFRYAKTKHKGWLITIILSGISVVLFLIAFVTSFFYVIYKEVTERAPTVVMESEAPIPTYHRVSLDGDSVFIEIPDYWELLEDLNKDAIFQAGSSSRNEYLIAIHYEKESMDGGLGVVSDFLIQGMLANLEDPAVVSIERIVISGMDAYQYDLSGGIDDLKVAYLHTVIEGSEYYYQILAWTAKFNKRAVFPVFREVVDSINKQDI